ncbi:SRPBCC domain-containing protein [Oceanobacillus iheyensis]|uniref:SRPBCC domain-containing protein n=1 Tax=Oceanobacillus iheyensis TaxID=182710 RepID=UPI0036411EC2
MEWISVAKKEIVINTSAEKVWEALTIPSLRNKWETKRCEIDFRKGGKIYLEYGRNVTFKGVIIEIIENEKLVLKDIEGYLTTWTIQSQDEGTKLSIEYTGNWVGDHDISEMENMLFRTFLFMLNLKTFIEDNYDQREQFWKSWLGLKTRTEIDRVKVVHVHENTPASGKVQAGDYIQAVNGEVLNHFDGCEVAITQQPVGSKIKLDIIRNNEKIKVTANTIRFGTLLK